MLQAAKQSGVRRGYPRLFRTVYGDNTKPLRDDEATTSTSRHLVLSAYLRVLPDRPKDRGPCDSAPIEDECAAAVGTQF